MCIRDRKKVITRGGLLRRRSFAPTVTVILTWNVNKIIRSKAAIAYTPDRRTLQTLDITNKGFFTVDLTKHAYL